MTPQEAALCLRDDPTFATASRLDQEAEAALLLDSDDPLDIAIAIETALQAPPAPVTARGGALEPCRLETPCGGREPLAGNGRCMTCGANRIEPPTPAAPPPAPRPKPKPKKKLKGLRGGIIYDPADSLVGRFKEVTGATDNELSAMLGKARTTIQAYCNGRLAEKLEDGGGQRLIDELADRMAVMAELKRDLAVALGEFTPD